MTAGVLRRFLAGTLDALPGAAMALLLAKLGLVPGRVLSPETGWFWSDWLVKAWLDAPSDLLFLASTLIVCICLTYGVFEHLGVGAAAWLLRLQTVDQDGETPSWGRSAARFCANVLCFCSLGLGFFWAFASRHRRTWADIFSGTCVTRSH